MCMIRNKIYPVLFLVIGLIYPENLIGQEDTLTLSQALAKSLQNNYSILLSKTDEATATLNNSWGNAGRYPTIRFDAASINQHQFGENNGYSLLNTGVGMNWVLFDGFRVVATKEKLEKLETLTFGRSAVTVENTIQDVILFYYNILLQKERLKVFKTVMGLSEDRYTYEKKRYDIGGSVSFEVLQAQNVYLEDKSTYLNQEVVVRNAVRDLNYIMGEDPANTWLFIDTFEPDTSEYMLDDLLTKMYSGNTTLQNQYINLLIQQDEIRIKRSAFYPSLSLSTGLEGIMDSRSDGFGDPALQGYGNLSLSYDLYTGGANKRAAKIAEINKQALEIETEEMKHGLTNLLLKEYDLYNIRKTLFEVAEENLEAAALNLKIADEKFKTGAINSFNFRDVQLIYLNASLRRLQAIYDLIASNTAITRITGGFISEED